MQQKVCLRKYQEYRTNKYSNCLCRIHMPLFIAFVVYLSYLYLLPLPYTYTSIYSLCHIHIPLFIPFVVYIYLYLCHSSTHYWKASKRNKSSTTSNKLLASNLIVLLTHCGIQQLHVLGFHYDFVLRTPGCTINVAYITETIWLKNILYGLSHLLCDHLLRVKLITVSVAHTIYFLIVKL